VQAPSPDHSAQHFSSHALRDVRHCPFERKQKGWCLLPLKEIDQAAYFDDLPEYKVNHKG
jgi:hypothetical protein